MGTLVHRLSGFSRVMAFRILHHCDGCVDAASCGIHPSAERNVQYDQFLGAADEPLGPDSIRAQHLRRPRHGSVRNGRGPRGVASTSIRYARPALVLRPPFLGY